MTAVGDFELPPHVNVRDLGSTTLLRDADDGVGHWRRRASVTVLAWLFKELGE